MLPIISFLLLLIISIAMDNLGPESEGIALMLIAIGISTGAIFVGNLIGILTDLFWFSLSEPNQSLKSGTHERPRDP